jgi:hypothetical protein
MRLGLIAFGALWLFTRSASAQLLAAPDANPLGIWRGTSRCVAARSGCTDEAVVYQITIGKTKDSLSITPLRLADRRAEETRMLACALNAARALITCAADGGKWRFAVRHDSLFGQFRMRDGTWLRDVHAVRSR